ncbi:MAG: DUF4349 domain-containing protein [Clostridia bacterium]|nr:DUF4349 domain-containing protein [Clostridia bacterium]
MKHQVHFTRRIGIYALAILLLFSMLFLVSCAEAGDYDNMGAESPSLGEGDKVENLLSGSTGTPGTSETRKIIKTVTEEIETESYDDFIASLKTAVADANGYISSSHYTGNHESSTERKAVFQIRIPAEALDSFTGSIGALGAVVSYTETQDDISLAYVDVQSRIEVLEAERVALLDILANASYTSEMLEIRAQLENVMQELASLEAQMRVYNDRIAYSTVNLTVREVEEAVAPVEETFLSKLGAAFRESLSGALGFLETLALVFLGGSPYLILLGLIGFVIFLSIYLPKRHRRKKKAEADAEKEKRQTS